ncbi:hypothetical protein A6768_11780 [Sphingobium yanoikuyae]|uniref:Uncharacterized protein n=2 Tax=Sphingobium yanoikuyae TaxID=13690 RepID=A0A291MZU7_SPHYA|nr:hypothetical protein A6768_11780 [Sphingobium yanoikuyae]
MDRDHERGRQIWMIAAPRMTRLAVIILRLRVGRGWSTQRICRRLHISRRTCRRHMGIAVRQIALAVAQLEKKKG